MNDYILHAYSHSLLDKQNSLTELMLLMKFQENLYSN